PASSMPPATAFWWRSGTWRRANSCRTGCSTSEPERAAGRRPDSALPPPAAAQAILLARGRISCIGAATSRALRIAGCASEDLTALDDIPARPSCGGYDLVLKRQVAFQRSNRKDVTMSITAERKTALIKEFAQKEGDTGSPEVQVAILT